MGTLHFMVQRSGMVWYGTKPHTIPPTSYHTTNHIPYHQLVHVPFITLYFSHFSLIKVTTWHTSFVGFVVHLLISRRVFQAKLSFSIYIFYRVCASGMACGIVSDMCKVLYHTTYPTSVPYQLMPYIPWSWWWLYYLCLSYKSFMKIVLFFSFSILLAIYFLYSLNHFIFYCLSLWLYSLNVYKIISLQHF